MKKNSFNMDRQDLQDGLKEEEPHPHPVYPVHPCSNSSAASMRPKAMQAGKAVEMTVRGPKG